MNFRLILRIVVVLRIFCLWKRLHQPEFFLVDKALCDRILFAAGKVLRHRQKCCYSNKREHELLRNSGENFRLLVLKYKRYAVLFLQTESLDLLNGAFNDDL